jgi:hypothetical protein
MGKESKTLPRYLIKLCSDKAAFEVKFSQKLRLNMESIKKTLESSKGFEIVMYTPPIVILRSVAGVEVTLSKEGRILIKNVSSKDEAEIITRKLLQEIIETALSKGNNSNL